MTFFNNLLVILDKNLHLIAEEIRNIRENQEYDRLKGLLTDEEKIRLLKYELYSSTSANVNPEKSQELRKTISLLSDEIEQKHARDNCLKTYLHEGAKTFLTLTALIVAASYSVQWSGVCNHVNSAFCRNARMIPNTVERYFYDEPSLVNPEKFNVNIDQSK